MTERVYIDTAGRDNDALSVGLAWLLDRAQRANLAGVVAVYALANAKRLAPPLSADLVRRLVRDKRAQLGAVAIELMTQRHEPRSQLGPTLGVWVNDRLLDRIEELEPYAVCVVPWHNDAIADWKANFAPIELRSGARSSAITVANPVVAAALEALTAVINIETGLGHPRDRASAIDLFAILRRGGERFEPAEVRAWAVNNDWSSRSARELEEIAAGVLAGRRFRSEADGWSDDALDQWRTEARTSED